MNVDKLKRMSNAVRTGGKGTVRRKKKAPHRSTTNDDKRLQNTLKRLGVNIIPGIEEVNFFLSNNNVLHFLNPKVQASITANTYVVTGQAQEKKLSDLLPGIITQMGPESLTNLRRMAEQMQNMQAEPHLHNIAEEDDDDIDVPELVENFEEASAEVTGPEPAEEEDVPEAKPETSTEDTKAS